MKITYTTRYIDTDTVLVFPALQEKTDTPPKNNKKNFIVDIFILFCYYFDMKLMKHQTAGIEYLRNNNLNGYLCWWPGTGKTLTTLEATKGKRILVVCPPYVQASWENEVKKFGYGNSCRISRYNYKDIRNLDPLANVYVIHYGLLYRITDYYTEELLADQFEKLKSLIANQPLTVQREKIKQFKSKSAEIVMKSVVYMLNIDVVVFDEIHNIKNVDAIQSKLCSVIAQNCKSVIGLTGTPVSVSLLEMWHQMRVVFGRKFLPGISNFYHFRRAFFFNKTKHLAFPTWDIDQRSYAILKKNINDLIDIKKKSDCIDLPGKIYDVLSFEMSDKQKRVYKSLVRDHIASFSDGKNRADAKTAGEGFQKLLQVCAGFVYASNDDRERIVVDLGISGRIDYIKDYYESVKKLVVWFYYQAEFDALIKEFPSAFTIENWVNFQAADEGLIIVNVSNNEGIQLQSSSDALYMSLPMSLNAFIQSTERIHRVGMNDAPAHYTIMSSEGTVMEKVVRDLIIKFARVSDLTGSLSEIGELSKDLKNYLDEALTAFKEY